MNTVDRAEEIIEDRLAWWEEASYEPNSHSLAQALADSGLIAPDPQIIRTVEELEDLDPDTVVLDRIGETYPVRAYLTAGSTERAWRESDLPAVVVASGEYVRACREALEGEAE